MTAIPGQRRDMAWQLVRYVINGGLITLLYAAVYWLLVHRTPLTPQLANLAGYLVAVGSGYVLHSRVTFKGHGERDRATQVRFACASVLSYAVNAFWVWLFTARLGLPDDVPLIPITFVTPLLVFAINRWWVFR